MGVNILDLGVVGLELAARAVSRRLYAAPITVRRAERLALLFDESLQIGSSSALSRKSATNRIQANPPRATRPKPNARGGKYL